MAILTKNDLPVVSAAKFSVPSTALDDGTGAYGTIVGAGSGRYVAGNTIRGRKLFVVVQTHGALTGAPTGLKVCLLKATDANGTSAAEVTGSAVELGAPAASSTYTAEIDCALFANTATDFYSLGLALNGAGTTAVSASATAAYLEAPLVS